MSTVIEQPVEARLVAAAPRMPSIPATLHYDRSDPFAVRMTFPAPATLEGVEVCWTFARELLASGMEDSVGYGDVRVRPYGYDRTVLEFHAPEAPPWCMCARARCGSSSSSRPNWCPSDSSISKSTWTTTWRS